MNYEEKCIELDIFANQYGMLLQPVAFEATEEALKDKHGFQCLFLQAGGYFATTVNGHVAICASETAVAAMPLGQVKAILLHEQGHIAMGHLAAMAASGETGVSSSRSREYEADDWALKNGANPADLEAGLRYCVQSADAWLTTYRAKYLAHAKPGFQGTVDRFFAKAVHRVDIWKRIRRIRAYAA